jgi:hypothetical protein
MKCKECTSCRLGFFKSQPNSYVCIGVKEPFVILDIESECTEYPEKIVKTAKVDTRQLAKPFVDDNGIYGVSSSNPYYNYLIMSRELFVEAYNKWIRDPNTDDWK